MPVDRELANETLEFQLRHRSVRKFLVDEPVCDLELEAIVSAALVWIADLGRARRLAGRAAQPCVAADYLEPTFLGVIDAALAAQNGSAPSRPASRRRSALPRR